MPISEHRVKQAMGYPHCGVLQSNDERIVAMYNLGESPGNYGVDSSTGK